MKTHKTQAIVLHSIKYGETSLVVYMFTRHAGRQSYLVQGVRSAKSRTNRAALYQPMFPLEFEGLESSRSELLKIKDLKAIYVPNNLVYDISKSTISLFMAEIIYRLVREREANEPLFDFIYSSVEMLNQMEEGVSNFHLWFMVKLSYFLGFYPSNEYVSGYWFDIKEGGFLNYKPEHNMVMTREQSKILGQLINFELHDLSSLKLSGSSRSDFLNALISYFTYHFDAVLNIKSLEVLREVF